MALKSYATKAAYDAAVKPATESQVSMIETSRQIIVDGVNVITTEPAVGDVLFLDESNNRVYVKGGAWLRKAIIPSAWTHVGYVFRRFGRQVLVVNKAASDLKYLDVCQYSITAIAQTDITLKLRMSPDYNVDTQIPVTLTSTAIDATSAAEISAAVAAKATEVGDTKDWWAYLADADGNKVDTDGTQIIVQCDTCVDYRFYICSATGCTITHTTWGDMPESSVYLKNDGGYTSYWGVMNVARTRAWATNNGRVPTEMEPVKVTGNPAPVKPVCFEDKNDEAYQYTALIRAEYGTYDNYLRNGYGVKYPQKYGTFALPPAKTLSLTYARKTAPTKSGGTKYKYPAFYYCYATSYGVNGLDFGDWWLPGSEQGCYLVDDDTLATIAPSISEMGTASINNATYRWFAERCNANNARFFYRYDGYLGSIYVNSAFRAQAVTLLDV